MTDFRRPEIRSAVITELAERLNDRLGRTGVMKLMYFLQTISKVDFGYKFQLYTYGPYDSQVLDDLRVAEGLGAVHSKAFEWQGGSGYLITKGEKAMAMKEQAQFELSSAKEAIDWVVEKFGTKSASDLELASTIVFVDRSLAASDEKISRDELIRRVNEIKPHHKMDKIGILADELANDQLITSLH